jgi:hypothetical protein
MILEGYTCEVFQILHSKIEVLHPSTLLQVDTRDVRS